MAKVDLSSQAWCDLVFSGKNKAYGAYKMRETSPETAQHCRDTGNCNCIDRFQYPYADKDGYPQTERGDDRSDYPFAAGRTGSEAGRDEADRARGPTAACIEKLH